MKTTDTAIGKERAVQQMFSSAARRYDLNNTVLSLGLHHGWKRIAVEAATISPGDQVIDLCSGTADLAILLAQKAGPTGRVIALDLNPEMLTLGREKVAASRWPDTIQSIVGNMEHLNFPDATFHAATVAFGVRNTSHKEVALREMARVLKPGGRGVCLEFSRPTSAALRWAYDLYSFTLLPCLGRFLSRDRTGIYTYLPESIRQFPTQEKLRQMMLDAGFSRVDYKNLAGGIVAIHVGVK